MNTVTFIEGQIITMMRPYDKQHECGLFSYRKADFSAESLIDGLYAILYPNAGRDAADEAGDRANYLAFLADYRAAIDSLIDAGIAYQSVPPNPYAAEHYRLTRDGLRHLDSFSV